MVKLAHQDSTAIKKTVSFIEELGVRGSGNVRSVRRLKAGDLQQMSLLLAFQGMLESSTVLVV